MICLVLLCTLVSVTSCADDGVLSPVDIELLATNDTMPEQVKVAVDYCYQQCFELDYLYAQLPDTMKQRVSDYVKKLEVVLWCDDNTDEFGDTVGEGSEYETICNYIGREY